MIDKLIKLADYLDKSGFKEETDGIDALIKSAGRLSDALGKYPESENKVKKLYGNLPQRLLKYFAWAAEELIEGPRTSIEELVSLLGRFDDLKNTSKIKEQIPNLQDYPVSILRKVIEGYGKTSKEERRASRAKRDEESVLTSFF